MNREDRRKQARSAGPRKQVIAEIRVVACGEVMIQGEAWPAVFGGPFVLASKILALPDGAPRFKPDGLAVAQTWLTADTVLHGRSDDIGKTLRDIDAARRAASGATVPDADPELTRYMREARRSYGPLDNIPVDIAGNAYGWPFIAMMLALLGPDERVRLGLLTLGAMTAVRLEAPSVRLTVAPIAPWTGPRLVLLNEEQMAAMEDAKGDA